MFAWTSHGTELKRFLRQPITRAAVAVMLLIPLLYGAMYVWAFWDPTSGLDRLPVALVNEDVPTTLDAQRFAAGEKTVDTLLERKPFEWHQTSADDAREGVEKGRYYFAVSVPATYSADIASLKSDAPKSAHIDVTYDDTNSFLASTLGRSAMIQIRDAVNDVSGTEAVDKLLIGMGQAHDGLGTAADGAFRLRDGLTTAADGSTKLAVAADQLRDGAAQLATGNQALADGTHSLAKQVKPMAGQVGQLATGSAQLSSGLDALNQHLPQLTGGLASLDAAQQRYVDGVTRAGAGAHQLNQGAAALGQLSQGVVALDEGARKAGTGAQQLAAGLDTFAGKLDGAAAATGPQGTLYGGAAGVAGGAGTLHTGITSLSAQLAPGGQLDVALRSEDPTVRAAAVTKITQALGQLDAGSSQVAGGAAQVRDGIYSAAAPGDASTLHGALTQLRGSSTTGLGALQSGAHQLDTGLNAKGTDPATMGLVTALDAFAGKTPAMAGGIPALQAGLATMDDAFNNPDPAKGLIAGAKTIQNGVAGLDQGAQSMGSGVAALAKGSHQMTDGVQAASGKIPALVDGVAKLDSGAQQAAAGAARLRDGNAALAGKAPELANGLASAKDGAGKLGTALHDGQQQMPKDGSSVREDRAAAIASPVTLNETDIHKAESWGEGFSPFFIGIALWVGCLITWLLLRPLQTRALMTSVNGFRMAWGALNTALLLAVGQVVIMLTVMHFAIGLNPNNVIATIAFTTLCAFAFMAMQQACQVIFGSAVGKVIVIAMLMVQLASSGGTYPIETEPGFLRAVNPYLPMTYLVTGLREAITGGLDARFWAATLIMGLVFAISLALSSLFSARKRTWTMARLHPALSI